MKIQEILREALKHI